MESDDLRHLMVKDGAKIRIFHQLSKFYPNLIKIIWIIQQILCL